MLSKLRFITLTACLAASLCGAEVTAADGQYLLSAGDTVRVQVYGHEDLSGDFEIDSAGQLSVPLAGPIEAAGRTADDLEVSIEDALQPDYLKNPSVSVEVLVYRPIYVLGEVETPGSYPYSSGITVVNAVAIAGGFTYRARKGKIKIVRTVGTKTVEIRGEMSTVVEPGDVIEVPERFF